MFNEDDKNIVIYGFEKQKDGRFTIIFSFNGKMFTQTNAAFCFQANLHEYEGSNYLNICFEAVNGIKVE
jgi:hypothetical protein